MGIVTFELASRGGYVRTVRGTIAYLDDEAQTYMVSSDGELLRVPLRDIVSMDGTATAGTRPPTDEEGLGTGP